MEYEKTHFIFTHFKVSSEQKTNWMIPKEKIQLELEEENKKIKIIEEQLEEKMNESQRAV